MTPERTDAALRQAYENIASIDKMLAAPRPENVREYTLPQAEPENPSRPLRSSNADAVIRKEIAQLRSDMLAGVGEALGMVRKQVRDEFEKEIADLRSEIALLRAQKSVGQSRARGRRTTSNNAGNDGHPLVN
jgi:hypothetical protein